MGRSEHAAKNPLRGRRALMGLEAPLPARYLHVMQVKIMRVDVARAGGGHILAGAGVGRRTCAALLAEAGVAREPTLWLLDFGGVDFASASFLREAVLRLRDAARAQGSPLYPVVANLTEAVREELDDLLRRGGEAMATCRVGTDGAPMNPEILGELEPKQRHAFDLVRAAGEADVATLQALDRSGEQVGHTAWNNRLAALAAKGVLIESQHGRTKRYRPVLPGV